MQIVSQSPTFEQMVLALMLVLATMVQPVEAKMGAGTFIPPPPAPAPPPPPLPPPPSPPPLLPLAVPPPLVFAYRVSPVLLFRAVSICSTKRRSVAAGRITRSLRWPGHSCFLSDLTQQPLLCVVAAGDIIALLLGLALTFLGVCACIGKYARSRS